MPETTWVDGDNATAALLNQIEDQLVVTCTAATRPTGAEGRLCYETDTNKLMIYDGSAWNVIGGGDWVTFTPTWANVTQGSGATNNGRYRYADGGMWVRAAIALGTGGSVTGNLSLTIPNSETSDSTTVSLGNAQYKDGTSDDIGMTRCETSATTINLYTTTTEANATNPFTFGNGDQIIVTHFVPL